MEPLVDCRDVLVEVLREMLSIQLRPAEADSPPDSELETSKTEDDILETPRVLTKEQVRPSLCSWVKGQQIGSQNRRSR